MTFQVTIEPMTFLKEFFSLYFSVALRPNAGHGLLIFLGFLIAHNDASHSAGLLWTSDRLIVETSSFQHRTTSMHPAGFEPTIGANKRPQTHTLDRVAIRIDICQSYEPEN
jgi:hypothetical protein